MLRSAADNDKHLEILQYIILLRKHHLRCFGSSLILVAQQLEAGDASLLAVIPSQDENYDVLEYLHGSGQNIFPILKNNYQMLICPSRLIDSLFFGEFIYQSEWTNKLIKANSISLKNPKLRGNLCKCKVATFASLKHNVRYFHIQN